MPTNNWSAAAPPLNAETLATIHAIRSEINAAANNIGINSSYIAVALSEEIQDQLDNYSAARFMNVTLDVATKLQATHAAISADYAWYSSRCCDPPNSSS